MKLLIITLFTILFVLDRWLKCGSLKRKTDNNPSASSVIEISADADKFLSIKKLYKYYPSYLQMGFSILNKDGITLDEC